MTMLIKVQINGQKFKQSKMCNFCVYMCMGNVVDRFHHLDFGYQYDDKAFHTNHPFYVKDIASFSHKNHILRESTWSNVSANCKLVMTKKHKNHTFYVKVMSVN